MLRIEILATEVKFRRPYVRTGSEISSIQNPNHKMSRAGTAEDFLGDENKDIDSNRKAGHVCPPFLG